MGLGRCVHCADGCADLRCGQDGYLEVSLSALGPESMRAFAAKLRNHPQHLYCLKLKVSDVAVLLCCAVWALRA